jgi:mannose-1-phosphate guanylyltransferase
VARKSSKATVALFPSDHYFADDMEFMSHVDNAFESVERQPEKVVLLGITPTGPETEYGWIEPQPSILGGLTRSVTRVKRFWEKPDTKLARELMERESLWNSFVMVGRVDAFLNLTRLALPGLYSGFSMISSTFGGFEERNALRSLYSQIPESNYSHEVLATNPESLSVMRVGEVGWSDLGEPTRVLATLARIGVESEMAASAS